MTSRDFGAACDISVVTGRDTFEGARQILGGSPLYLPSATYSWLSRDKLISVRGRAVSYSLVSQFVRDRQLLIVYLPELLDELSRRILFDLEREIPLTDIRALMLASHLGVPLFTFSDEPVASLQRHFGASTLFEREIECDPFASWDETCGYQQMADYVADYLMERIENEDGFQELPRDFNRRLNQVTRRPPNPFAQSVQRPKNRVSIKFVA